MCLAVPAKIIELNQGRAKVEVGGITRQASMALLPDATVGDYVLIHAGFAITLVDEKEALGTLRIFDEIARSSSASPEQDDNSPSGDPDSMSADLGGSDDSSNAPTND